MNDGLFFLSFAFYWCAKIKKLTRGGFLIICPFNVVVTFSGQFKMLRGCQVVSCDLIPIMWGNAFSTQEYISEQTKILPYPSPLPCTFHALKMSFYLLKHNVPSYFTCLPVYALYFALYFNGTELVERSTQNVR